MEKLKFVKLISGIRVDLSDELWKKIEKDIDRFGYVKPINVPDFVLYGIWWETKGINIEFLFIKDSDKVRVRKKFGDKEELTTDYYSKSFYEILFGRLSQDDQVKVWLYKNEPELWKQLVDYFGSDKKVFDNYVRFNH